MKLFFRLFLFFYKKKLQIEKRNALIHQKKIFKYLIKEGKKTTFGQQHNFKNINTHNDFVTSVSMYDYEKLKPYIEQIKQGQQNVLWKGIPLCFAKTSGTTSGIKYIPITKHSLPHHIFTARKALISYVIETQNFNFLKGKMIFLSGSPQLDYSQKIPIGRLSGIVNNYVPKFYKRKQLPQYQTNCINDWEKKLDKIVEETKNQNMTVISGIPPWVQMYFEKLLQATNKKNIKSLFPNFSLFIYGGVNFEPYRRIFKNYIGQDIDSIETYPASEGFIAYQDKPNQDGMLLNTNAGIFYEFITTENFFNNMFQRITLKDVVKGVNYVILLSSNAGMWAYNIGDIIRFVSLDPYRIIVIGRVKHFISAFGEHIIAEEVEYAMSETIKKMQITIKEFTVAPHIVEKGNAHHDWFIEFEQMPDNLDDVALELNKNLCNKNIYYDDLIKGKILKSPSIIPIEKNGFIKCMKDMNKLGEQNKVPRLSNDRVLAQALEKYVIKYS